MTMLSLSDPVAVHNAIADAVGEPEAKLSEALSPFLPGTNTQFAWDSTSIGYLKQCPRLYQYTMIEGWRPKDEVIHLRFGIEYHQALHDYELCRATGIPHDDAVHDTVRALMTRCVDYPNPPEDAKPSIRFKTKEALVRLVTWYLEDYRDGDPAVTVILADRKPAMEVSFRFELDWGPGQDEEWAQGHKSVQPYLLCGHLDRIVDFGGARWVMDRKTTTTTLGSYYFERYDLDGQMTLYTLASQVVLGQPVRGVIIDGAQILDTEARFVRGMTYRTADQLDEWVQDLKFWFAQAENFANFNHWPMNVTSCDKFGGCRFREVCAKSPHAREPFLNSKFVKGERWNPLRSR